jgi:hypothetical protein
MAGRITISTLNDDTGVLATQNGMSGIAKAWIYFNGTTATIRGSMNVSSVTRVGTGQYRVNFTTAMPDANYSSVATSQEYTADAVGQATKTTTQCSIWNVDSRNYGYVDTTGMNVAFFR